MSLKICDVYGCKKKHRCAHILAATEPIRTQWVAFIYLGNPPELLPKRVYACSYHFTPDCLTNAAQYTAGFANKLRLKPGAVPTVRYPTSSPEKSFTASPGLPDLSGSVQPRLERLSIPKASLKGKSPLLESTSENEGKVYIPNFNDVACQTEFVPRTVATQLSLKTLGPVPSSSGTQTSTKCDCCVQSPAKRPRLELEEENLCEGTSAMIVPEVRGFTKPPADLVSRLTEPQDVIMKPSHRMATYIVYESLLLQLFRRCPVCRRVSNVRKISVGLFLSVEQQCSSCAFYRIWNSQPIPEGTPLGNLQLSVALYATGASFYQLAKVFEFLRTQMVSYETYHSYVQRFIEPAIIYTWKTVQDGILQQLRDEQSLVLRGDMKTDSSGHSAAFGTCSVMALKTNTIIDLQLVQSNEVQGSKNMGKEGLRRSLEFLRVRGVAFDSIITEPQTRVEKFLEEANITHYYDVKHLEKGLSKKLLKIFPLEDCEELQNWLSRVRNHLHRTAASSSSPQERVATWKLLLNQELPIREDASLDPVHHSKKPSQRFAAGTPAFYRLEKLFTNKRILKVMEKLSPHRQASPLQAFHRVILQFVPKNAVFSYIGRLCRLYLAVLHFNENAAHTQASTTADEPLSNDKLMKNKKGRVTGNAAKREPSFNYVEDLLHLVVGEVVTDPAPYMEELRRISTPVDRTA